MTQNPTPTMKNKIKDAIVRRFTRYTTGKCSSILDTEIGMLQDIDHLLPDGYVEEGEGDTQFSFQDVIEARIKYFNSKHHTYEGSELQQALNTIRRLVPPIQFKIGVQSFPPIELKNLQNTKK